MALRSIKTIAIPVFTLFMIGNVFGNDGAYSFVKNAESGAAMPINNTFISMVSENIEIKVSDLYYHKTRVGEYMYGNYLTDGKVITRCTFVFANTSSERQSCLMGFPIKYPVDKTVYFSGNGKRMTKVAVDDFPFFECRVNGKTMPYVFADHEDNPAVPKVSNYDGVYLFETKFEPRETITIENISIQDLSCGFKDTPAIEYVLLSGLTWNKPIGKTDISVEFAGLPSEIIKILKCSYPMASASNGRYSWSFKDFTPAKDLYLEFDFGISTKTGLGEAFRKYEAAREYDKIFWLHQIVETRGNVRYSDIKVPGDELRLIFFNAGNYYHKLCSYYKANEMYMAAISADQEFRKLMQKMEDSEEIEHSDSYSDWMDYMDHSLSYGDKTIQNLRQQKIPVQKGQKAPLYYLLYNLACTESLTGDADLVLIEMALIWGYPKSEYKWIREDPDLYLVRRLWGNELTGMLDAYAH